jgi:hypothetical protein
MTNKIELYCWIIGDEPNNIFLVQIEKNSTVVNLKEAIKTKKVLERPADKLVLWKVSHFCQLSAQAHANVNLCKVCVPANRDLKAKVAELKLHDKNALFPTDDLTDVFQSDLPRKSIHVVARYGPADGKLFGCIEFVHLLTQHSPFIAALHLMCRPSISTALG